MPSSEAVPAARPTHPLDASVQFLRGVGPERYKRLEKLGILTVGDLLWSLPRRYLDRSTIRTIASLQLDQEAVIQGRVLNVSVRRTRRRNMRLLEVTVADDTGMLRATWFNQDWLANTFRKGQQVVLSGKVKFYEGLSISHPDYDILEEADEEPDTGPSRDEAPNTVGIIPVYRLTEGLGQKFVRRLVREALDAHAGSLEECFDAPFRTANGLIPVADAFREGHLPTAHGRLEAARRRLAWEELFLHQLALALQRQAIRREPVGIRLTVTDEIDARIRRRYPFTLTKAQEKVLKEIRRDLSAEAPMMRLLQGDVGSGKTAIALYALLAAVGQKAQGAFLAPTEILAEQHFRSLQTYLKDSRVRFALLTGGLPAAERRSILERLRSGELDLVVGTHALLEPDVAFKALAVGVVDEQHRFGVMQRAALSSKGVRPHTLVMTATPIPRTLAMTAYGELDVSILDEMPPGRTPVKTTVKPSTRLDDVWKFIRKEVSAGRQAYVVFPLIDESDTLALSSAKSMFKKITKEVFPDFAVALLHGSLPAREKDAVMERFRSGEVKVLVTTVVIEVGIDVPNATVMAIAHAERHGLAQLHQLRGRIGRGAAQSHCILLGEAKTEEAVQRLEILAKTNDGFQIADEDLRIRGPGELLGVRQSGLPEFKVADLLRDQALLREARQAAFDLAAKDPGLGSGAHGAIARALQRRFGDRVRLGRIG